MGWQYVTRLAGRVTAEQLDERIVERQQQIMPSRGKIPP
jgi:hypothetical protein